MRGRDAEQKKDTAAESARHFQMKKTVEIVAGDSTGPAPEGSGSTPKKEDDPCEKVPVLTPIAGVRLAWAMTGGFPQSNVREDLGENASQATGEKGGTASPAASQVSIISVSSTNAEKMLACEAKTLPTDPKQIQYVRESTLAIRAAVRNLSTVYRGRELNFRENDGLRNVYMNAIKEDLSFVINLKNFAKALPGAVISGGVGLVLSVASQQILGVPLTEIDILRISIIAGIAGIIVFFLFNLITRWRQTKFYVRSEHQRTLYFRYYLDRSKKVLIDLYYELALQYHHYIDNTFTNYSPKKCPHENYNGYDEIDLILKGLYPTSVCENADKCIHSWFFRPRWWIHCETQGEPETTTTRDKPGADSPGIIDILADGFIVWVGKIWPVRWATKCPYKKWMDFYRGLSVFVVCLVIVSVVLSMIWSVPGGVTLTKSPATSALYKNQTLNVSIVLNNTGSSDISGITIDDTIPAAFILESGNLTRSEVFLGRQKSMSMQYTIRSRYTGNFTVPQARAVFTNSGGDSRAILSNTPVFEVLSSGEPPANMSIAKSVSPVLLGENETLTVRVIFKNTGSADITNLVLSDPAPGDFVFIDGDSNLSVPLLKATESRSFKYTLRSGNAGTYILNPATAWFNNSQNDFTHVESESPMVEVRSDYSAVTSANVSMAILNASKFTSLSDWWKITFPFNKTA